MLPELGDFAKYVNAKIALHAHPDWGKPLTVDSADKHSCYLQWHQSVAYVGTPKLLMLPMPCWAPMSGHLTIQESPG